MAAKFHVSERSVCDAADVLKHGSPELQQAVERGEMSVSAAAKKAAEQEEARQIIANNEDEIREWLKKLGKNERKAQGLDLPFDELKVRDPITLIEHLAERERERQRRLAKPAADPVRDQHPGAAPSPSPAPAPAAVASEGEGQPADVALAEHKGNGAASTPTAPPTDTAPPTPAADSVTPEEPEPESVNNVAIAKLLVDLAKHLAEGNIDPGEIAAYVFKHSPHCPECHMRHWPGQCPSDDDDFGLLTDFDEFLYNVSRELLRLDIREFFNTWHAMHGDKWIGATAAEVKVRFVESARRIKDDRDLEWRSDSSSREVIGCLTKLSKRRAVGGLRLERSDKRRPVKFRVVVEQPAERQGNGAVVEADARQGTGSAESVH